MLSLRRPVYILFASCLVVHAGILLTARARTGRIDGYALKSRDCGEFYRLAQNLVTHRVFSTRASEPLDPDTWRTPGYPVFLALAISILGDSPTSLVVVQQALSILNILLLFLIARTWMSERRALLTSILFLIEPYHLFYSLWLLSTTLFVTFLLLAWLTWQRTLSTGRSSWTVCLGLVTGLTILIRPAALLVPPALAVGLFIAAVAKRRAGSEPTRSAVSWTAVPIFAIACFAPVCGWMLRNQAVAGHFALSDQGGVVLAYFKSAEVELWHQGRTRDRYTETTLDAERLNEPHIVWESIDEELRERFSSLPESQQSSLRWQNLAQGNRSKVDSFAVSAALSQIGLSRLAEHPMSTAVCYLVRCGSILTFPLNLAIKVPTSVLIDRPKAATMGCIYLALCSVVFARMFRGCLAFSQLYFPAACAVALLLVATPQIDPRFRVPLIPLLIVLALLPQRSPPPDGDSVETV